MAKVHPDKVGFADDVLFRYKAPVAAVGAVVAVIAHHEILALRYFALNAGVVWQISTGRGIAREGELFEFVRIDHRLLFDGQNIVGDRTFFGRFGQNQAQNRLIGFRIGRVLSRRNFTGFRGQMVGLAVDRQDFVFIANHIARLTHHALDVALRFVRWKLKHDDLTFFRVIHRHHHVVGDRHAQAVGVFIDQNEVTHVQIRQHRAGRNAKRLDHERAQYEHQGNHTEQTRGVFEPRGACQSGADCIVISTRRLGADRIGGFTTFRCENEFIEQPKNTRNNKQYQQ